MATDNGKISSLAGEVMGLSHDRILMHLRFFDRALSVLQLVEKPGTGCFATNGQSCFYDPVHVLKCYRETPERVTRTYLHMLLHCIFAHHFRYDRLEGSLWDLAADMAVENVILELGLEGTGLEQDALLLRKLEELREKAQSLTAERLYRCFAENPLPPEEEKNLRQLFFRDAHSLWMPAESLEMTREQWEKISRRIKTDLKSFADRKSGTGSLEQNLGEGSRERYD